MRNTTSGLNSADSTVATFCLFTALRVRAMLFAMPMMPTGSQSGAGSVPAVRGEGQGTPSPAVVGPPAKAPGPAEGRGAEPGPEDDARHPSEPDVDEMMEEVYATLTAAV